jgi:hypothetical protein
MRHEQTAPMRITPLIKSQVAKAWSGIEASPPLLRVAVVIGAVLLGVFCAALRRSSAGEIAGALGSLIGGVVGAGGAVWAVFLMLSRQRNEETEKVAEAVRTEVTTLVKYAIGAVKICEQIKTGIIKVPRQDAHYIVKNLAGGPIIYPAVADRVGLLRHPQATAEFYMRIFEAKIMVEMLRTKTDVPGIMYTATPVELVTPQFAGSVADSLLTALQLARSIVAYEEMWVGKPQFTAWVQSVVVAQIDDCLASAKETFPDAESFKFPPPRGR